MTTLNELCEFERDVLKSIVGIGPALAWGAAVGAAFEHLRGSGYIKRVAGVWRATDKGRKAVGA